MYLYHTIPQGSYRKRCNKTWDSTCPPQRTENFDARELLLLFYTLCLYEGRAKAALEQYQKTVSIVTAVTTKLLNYGHQYKLYHMLAYLAFVFPSHEGTAQQLDTTTRVESKRTAVKIRLRRSKLQTWAATPCIV